MRRGEDWTRQTPGDLFGAQPNALAFDRSRETVVCVQRHAERVAVVEFEPEDNASKVIG